jgi:hypothetical protein
MRVYSHEEIKLRYEEPQMTDISVVGPDGGEQMLTGPVRMRILEDGSTTGHRWASGRSPSPRTPKARRSTGTAATTGGSTS